MLLVFKPSAAPRWPATRPSKISAVRVEVAGLGGGGRGQIAVPWICICNAQSLSLGTVCIIDKLANKQVRPLSSREVNVTMN